MVRCGKQLAQLLQAGDVVRLCGTLGNITWFNDGTFSSFIAAGVDSENTYSLSFSEPSNVVITLLDDFLSFQDNEYITISTIGGNKSISLVNICRLDALA